jgi:hypothetical protein
MMGYEIAGFHFDMLDFGFGPPYGCWCDVCREAFRKKYGIEMPAGVTWDEAWDRMLDFRCASNAGFSRHLEAFVKARRPEISVDFNYHGYPPFNWVEWNKKSFDEPFYYGRFQKMVMILIFDRPKWIRFYVSPSGGGESLIPGISSPAWDFEWIIPEKDYQINRDYKFRVRLVYKQYESDEDVLKEFRKAQDELGFEKVR